MKSIKILLYVFSAALFFYAGVIYSWHKMDKRLYELRGSNLRNESYASDPIKSIDQDFKRIADEKLLLKKHIEISEKYLQKGDIDGLKKWIFNMKEELSKNNQ